MAADMQIQESAPCDALLKLVQPCELRWCPTRCYLPAKCELDHLPVTTIPFPWGSLQSRRLPALQAPPWSPGQANERTATRQPERPSFAFQASL